MAVAAILAYLLDPVVEFMVARGIARTKAVLYVFALALLFLGGIGVWVVPQLYRQSVDLGTQIPKLVETARIHGMDLAHKYQSRYADNQYIQQVIQEAQTWAQQQLPGLPQRIWNFVVGSVEGFLGAFGFLLGLDRRAHLSFLRPARCRHHLPPLERLPAAAQLGLQG